MGALILLRFFIIRNEVCNTAYALWRIHEQNSLFNEAILMSIHNIQFYDKIRTFS